ncbi:SIR2 family protein [Urbifossiella limnaea]|uniref:Uncharacterized protein n=1 Tax=Urbifossiella limnaea TaxID=2528023 RepID=A0A517XLS2_9BACT|nr:SIR2 family protein [Urbifossiella limnaea]QDU18460.1 hypothetical protein ETAA1_03480 [Urbifossiella limnaea]
MVDPLDALAFSMSTSKGVYALLLGSGVSRSASIPTGWDIILDLVRKLAKLQGADPEPDPEKWFVTTFGEAPSYSVLLDKLGKTGAERQAVLKGYIEPTEEDREAGRKAPTRAHRGIAELAAGGHVKVILTTNFDRLMESALEGAGVTPQVIASPDAVAGMTPLPHGPVTVIKLHGDYLDARIKNTIEELETYDTHTNRLLDRVLDEYGMVVSGWSGEWDTALRAAIERCPNRRYATYWNAFREPTGRGAELVRLRAAQVVPNLDADTFFTRLAEKVKALEDYSRPHPLSTAAAVSALKRYIPEPVHRIRLAELVATEANSVTQYMRETHVPPQDRLTFPAAAARAEVVGSRSETVVHLLAAGGYWGAPEQVGLWVDAIERLSGAVVPTPGFSYPSWEGLRLLPALLGWYACGLGALAAKKYTVLRALLYDVRLDLAGREVLPVTLALDPYKVVHKDVGDAYWMPERKHTPVNEWLHRVLKPAVRPYMATDGAYDQLFDRYELLRTLVESEGSKIFSPSRFWYQHNQGMPKNAVNDLLAEVEQQGKHWGGFLGGLFSSKRENFDKAWRAVMEQMQNSGVGYR